ncbi:MAG: single-stranded-DNA-specific exonuclease RecJ [Gammaproteobacteria bacterium]|nr:single-stranded-DNA-specific exonuclease RecJ [Gammaproteobacteria bacterium]
MRVQRLIRRREAGAVSPLTGIHPVLARVLAARGISSPDQLELTLNRLHPPRALSGIEQAAGHLADAIEGDARLLVVGDFDADGATSTALSMRVLKDFGAKDVHYRVPNRFEDGYGLTPKIVEAVRPLGAELLLTVDNGVTALAGVQAAKDAGMRVVVTDHHLPGAELPLADALVNPNLPGDGFPSKHLAGVGVAFYVLSALRAELGRRGWFERRGMEMPNLARYLDLVALGTVADMVPLDYNNRVLVEQGLRRMRAGQAVPGILSLLAVSGRDFRRAVASDLGFGVGPRLNAAGRMEDMSIGIQCLLAEQPEQARRLAEELHQLNAQRQTVEAEMQQQALAILKQLHERLDAESLPRGVCLFDPDWHQGVIGILASRIKERLHRPVIAFAPDGNGGIKGSARSIPGLHLRDALEEVDAQNPGLIQRFGGHAMAAGLQLPQSHFKDFALAFDAVVRRKVADEDWQGILLTDGPLEPGEMTLELAELLRYAQPWGQHMPEPLFDDVFRVRERWPMGAAGNHWRFVLEHRAGGAPFEAVLFNTPAADLPQGDWWRAAYRLDVNEFRGNRRLQLMLEQVEAAPTAAS